MSFRDCCPRCDSYQYPRDHIDYSKHEGVLVSTTARWGTLEVWHRNNLFQVSEAAGPTANALWFTALTSKPRGTKMLLFLIFTRGTKVLISTTMKMLPNTLGHANISIWLSCCCELRLVFGISTGKAYSKLCVGSLWAFPLVAEVLQEVCAKSH